jgi:hydrogenase-4 component E
MLLLFLIMYAVSLLYVAVTERFRHYAWLVGAQGWLLLGIALMQLGPGEGWGAKIFVMAETLLCKGILVPYLLFRIIRNTKINRVSRRSMSAFVSILVSVAVLVVSLSITRWVDDSQINTLFFGVSLFGLLTGLVLITTRQRIFSHLVGFLIIENAVFLFSLAVGTEFPMLVNVGILLDILMGVLLLGLFLSKIGDRLPNLDHEKLSSIKD